MSLTRRERVDVHLGSLDGASKDPDVTADCPPFVQILPAAGDTLMVIDRQVSGGHRLRIGNGILLLERIVLCDELVNPLFEFFGTLCACQ